MGHPRVRGSMRSWIDLRIHARGVAARPLGGGLVSACDLAVVDSRQLANRSEAARWTSGAIGKPVIGGWLAPPVCGEFQSRRHKGSEISGCNVAARI